MRVNEVWKPVKTAVGRLREPVRRVVGVIRELDRSEYAVPVEAV